MTAPFTKIRNSVISFLYRYILKPIYFMFDAEDVHDHMTLIGRTLGKYKITRTLTSVAFNYKNKALEQTIAGIHFKNPIGLAAGFDKNAKLLNILPSVGFGFEEAGSITGEPCKGNPKPRLWRHPEIKSLRVYYGLMNDGAVAIAKRLKNKTFKFPVGISIAKTNCEATANTHAAIADYLKSYRIFHSIGDYITINISCPGVCGGQPFTDTDRLNLLLDAVDRERDKKPIFIKLSPDLSEQELFDIATVALKHRITGLIASNLVKEHDYGKGGLSGKTNVKKSLAQLIYLRKTFRTQFVLIACGGIFNADDAYERICHGASLIQLIAGMIYEGPQTISEINRGLVERLQRDGFKNISEAVGAGISNLE